VQPTHTQVELGSGSFGKVYRAKYRGMLVALKTVSFAKAREKETFLREVSIDHGLHHPFIISFYGGAIKKMAKGDEGWLVFELMAGDLSHAIHYPDRNPGGLPLSEEQRLTITSQVLCCTVRACCPPFFNLFLFYFSVVFNLLFSLGSSALGQLPLHGAVPLRARHSRLRGPTPCGRRQGFSGAR